MAAGTKMLLVFNQRACSGRAVRLLPAIRQAFSKENIALDELTAVSAQDTIERLASAALQEYGGVIAAGGDGTLFAVLNGLYRQPGQNRPALGVLPIGTGNAFARDLGLAPGDWRRAVGLIARGQRRQVDVGRVRSATAAYHFLNIVGMGFAVDAGLTAMKLKRLGKSAYTLGTLWQTLKLKSYPLRLEVDGNMLDQDNVFAEISNTRYTGTHFLLAPCAQMDDGLLDLTLLRSLPRWRLLRLFPTIYTGRHVDFDEVTTLKARTVRIVSPANYPLAADGEFLGETPAEITCLHRDLTLFGP